MNILKFQYCVAVGSLIWLASGTRPDIVCAVSKVARFDANQRMVHWKTVVTANMGIKYSANIGY